MLFYVGSVKYGYYGCADDILKAYPNITNWKTKEIETRYGLDKQLMVELNTAEDIIRFTDEVEHEILIEGTLASSEENISSILIYDDYME